MYTEEQKREALRVLDECDGRVTAAVKRLGYPSRQCLYQWINERDAAHVRTNRRVGEGGEAHDVRGGPPLAHPRPPRRQARLLGGLDVAERRACKRRPRARLWEAVAGRAPGGPHLAFYDEGRIKESLGWLSPSDYRRSIGLAA